MNKTGFTLIELIIVIAIVALLAAGTFVAVDPAKRIGEARDAQRWSDITAIDKAIELYTADNGALPTDFSTTTVGSSSKVVLCTASAALTCDGNTKGCLVVDDNNFLGTYLNSLPIAPGKSTDTDTGYYLTRGSSGSITIGSCDTYDSSGVEMATAVELPAYSVVCGDGLVQDNEVCDDGDTETEGCGNGVREASGTFCNSACTSEYELAEACDYPYWESHSCYTPDGWYTPAISPGKYCKSNCANVATFCLPPP